MLRYTAYILIVLATIGLASGVTVSLVGGAAGRLATAESLHLVASDWVGRTGGGRRVRGLVSLVDGRTETPVEKRHFMYRVADGRVGTAYGGPRGFARPAPHGITEPGVVEYTAYLPENEPLLGLAGSAEIWVRPETVHVVWVDAAAVPPPNDGVAAGAGTDRLNHLARTHQLVYVVDRGAREYKCHRRRLREADVPAGPAVYVLPHRRKASLRWLRAGWPDVAVVVAANADFARLAREVVGDGRVMEVPPPGDEARDAGEAWDAVLRRVRNR